MNLFQYYSYITEIFWSVLDICPPFIRRVVFKMNLGSLGKQGNIDYQTYMRNMKTIFIGDDVWINRGCKLYASYHVKDAKIIIENNVAFGPNVTIFGAGHDYSKLSLPDTARTVLIEDNVWIGGNTTILQGATIGRCSVVAAGSVVTTEC